MMFRTDETQIIERIFRAELEALLSWVDARVDGEEMSGK